MDVLPMDELNLFHGVIPRRVSKIPLFLRACRVVHSKEKPQAWVDDFVGSAKLVFCPGLYVFL